RAAQEAVAWKRSGKKRAWGLWLAGCGMLLGLLVVSLAGSAQAQIFGTPQNLSNNPGESGIDQLVVMGSNIYVVWSDFTSGNGDIFFARSTDGGASFSAPRNLSHNVGSSFASQIFVAGSNVYVVWQDNTPGSYDIFFTRSTDGGANFSAPQNLSHSARDLFSPQLSVADSNLYVVWADPPLDNLNI